MRTLTTVQSLSAALATLKPAILPKNSIPILRMARFAGTAITGTDLEISITTQFVAVSADTTALCIEYKPLAGALKKLPKHAEVSLENGPDDHHAILTCGGITMTLPANPASSFPDLPPTGNVLGDIDAPTLATMVRQTRYCISKAVSRFNINGALLESTGDTLRMVATDGHRLSRSDRDASILPFRAILPATGIDAAVRTWGKTDATLTLCTDAEKQHYTLTDGRTRLLMRRLVGTFPDYERVIATPERTPLHLTLDRERLMAATARAGLVADAKSRAIRLRMNGDCRVECEMTGTGTFSESIPAAWNGPNSAIGMNADYLGEALASIPADTVTLEFQEPSIRTFEDGSQIITHQSAVMLRHDGLTLATMPLRVQ